LVDQQAEQRRKRLRDARAAGLLDSTGAAPGWASRQLAAPRPLIRLALRKSGAARQAGAPRRGRFKRHRRPAHRRVRPEL